MNAKLPLSAALLSLAVFGTGCEELEDLDLDQYVPTVTFKQLAVDEVDWDGVDSRFIFEVDNPNPININLARFDYALAFEQVEWLNGDSPDGLTLAADDASELALPVSFQFEELYDMVQAVRGQDDIGFALNGSFGFDTDWGPVDLPYAEDGGFPAPRKPDVSFNALQVADLSWSGATLDLKLDFDNAHGSNLFFRNVDYNVALAGIDVGGGYIGELGEVEGDSVRTLAVPIEVNFLDVGTALYDVLTGQNLRVDLDAVIDVDTPFGLVPLDLQKSGSVQLQR